MTRGRLIGYPLTRGRSIGLGGYPYDSRVAQRGEGGSPLKYNISIRAAWVRAV